MYTLIEYMKMAQDPLLAGYIETMYTEEKFMQYVPFRRIMGLALAFAREHTLPTPGFRKLNEAFAKSEGKLERKVEALRIFGHDSDMDKVLVDAYGPDERVAKDAMSAKAMSIAWQQYFCYGNSGVKTSNAFDNVDAFDGILSTIVAGQKIDGNGATGSDGSTVFAFKFGLGYLQGIQTQAGLSVRNLGELEEKPAYRTRIDWTSGYAKYNEKSVGIIYDLTVAATLTTALMDELADLIPGGPTCYLMSKRSRRQLKASAHTLGIALGVTLDKLGNPITSWDGVPIIVSDAILDNEAVA